MSTSLSFIFIYIRHVLTINQTRPICVCVGARARVDTYYGDYSDTLVVAAFTCLYLERVLRQTWARAKRRLQKQ